MPSKVELRQRIGERVHELGLTATEHALSALVEAADRDVGETLGDSDNLLVGILSSGSYTGSLLAEAGVDIDVLAQMAGNQLSRTHYWRESDPEALDDLLDPMFRLRATAAGHAFTLAHQNGHCLETSHLLEAAVSPSLNYWGMSESLHSQIEERTQLLLEELASEIYGTKAEEELRNRRERLHSEEQELVASLATSQLETTYGIALLDHWFTARELLVDPLAANPGLFERYFETSFGGMLFAQSGGRYDVLTGAITTERFHCPERDYTQLVLNVVDGHFIIAQRSHRRTHDLRVEGRQGQTTQRVMLETPVRSSFIDSSVLAEFGSLIDSDGVAESQIQRFLERYPEILQSMGAVSVHPRIALRPGDRTSLIPDFVLRCPGVNAAKILDLKLPGARVVARTPYARISRDIAAAVAQLRKYRSYFDVPANREHFRLHYGFEPFQPELVVVIGSSKQFRSVTEYQEIQGQTPEVQVLTYDDLFEYARSRVLPLLG